MFSEYELRNEHLTSIKPTTGYPVSRSGFGRGASGIEAQNTVAIPVCKLMTYMTTVLNINFPNVFGFYFLNDTRLDKIRSEVIRKELEISGIQDVRSKHKGGSTILKEWTIPDSRNTPSTTNIEEEEIVDALGNDGNASMPE